MTHEEPKTGIEAAKWCLEHVGARVTPNSASDHRMVYFDGNRFKFAYGMDGVPAPAPRDGWWLPVGRGWEDEGA